MRPAVEPGERHRSEAHPDSPLPGIAADAVPAVGAAQMAAVDRLATEEFGIAVPQMMEQAGAHLAEVARVELGGLPGRRILVAVGPGNNGGGGLAAARHLANRGATVRVILARPVRRLTDPARDQLATLLQMPVSCCVATYDLTDDELESALAEADLVVDALLGYNAAGPAEGEVGRLIGLLGRARRPIVSLDLPSGLDPDSGRRPGVAVRAIATMTLALPKTGLLQADGPDHAGRIYLADIGLPAALYARLGLEVDAPFRDGPIVRLESAGPPAA